MGVITEENYHIPPALADTTNDNVRVFISYRREDSAGFARAIEVELAQALGKEKVFIDVDDIKPGTDYQDHIHQSIYSCDVLVVVIGKNWNTPTGNESRRLDDPNDWVRQEVAIGLNRNIKVIPVLLQGVTMSDLQHLPEELERLTRYEAIEISNTQFKLQVEQLVSSVRDALKRSIWRAIKLWIMRKRILAACIIIFVLGYIGLNHEKIQHVTFEYPADILRSIGLIEGEFISDQFNNLNVRDLTITLYEKTLEYAKDDVHKAKVRTKLGLEYLMHQKKYKDKANEYFDQALGLLNNEINHSTGNPDVYLARAELFSSLGTSEEINNNLKKAENHYMDAISDYYHTYNDIDKASKQSKKDYADLNRSLATMMKKQKRYDKARKYYDESLKIYKNLELSSEGLEVAEAFLIMLKNNFETMESKT